MYTVIRDDREKEGHGWVFRINQFCEGTTVKRLPTGDYTIVGYDKLLTIERKGSLDEFAGNLFKKRFLKELGRMDSYKYPFVILEFNLEDMYKWPESSSVKKMNCGKCGAEFYKSVKGVSSAIAKYDTILCYKCLGAVLGKKIRPPKYISSRFKPSILIRQCLILQMQYKAKFIFAGNRGYDYAASIFKRVIELENNGKTQKSKNI